MYSNGTAVWFTAPSTTRHFLSNGDLLTETFYLYHPIIYEHILVVITYIYVLLKPLIYVIVITPMRWFWNIFNFIL